MFISYCKKFHSFLRKDKKSLLLLAILCLAFFLRIYKLDFQSFWYEELMTINYSKGKNLIDFFHKYHHTPDAGPPLYYLLIYFLRSLNTYSDWLLRFPSVLFGCAIVGMTYLIGKKLSGRNAGLLAALWAASSGALIYYSQEVRYNSALVFFILTYTYLFLSFHEKGKFENKCMAALMIGNIIVLTFLHYLGIAYILELAFLSAIFQRKNYKHLFKISALVAFVIVIFLPWLKIFLRQLNFWSIHKPFNSNPHFLKYLKSMIDYGFFYQTYWEKKNITGEKIIYYLQFFFYAFIIVSLLYYLTKRIKEKNIMLKDRLNFSKTILWFSFCFNVFIFFLIDYIGSKRYFYEKNLLFSIPFLYLLLAHIFTKIFTEKECLIVGLLTAFVIISRPVIFQNYYAQITKTEFKQTAELISKDPLHNQVIVLCGDKRWYDYYFSKYNIQNYTFAKNDQEIFSLIKKHGKAWLVFAHCFISYDLEIQLSQYQALQAYPAHSLVFAKLFHF